MLRVMMTLLLALVAGCSHELTADAVLLVESSGDFDFADGAVEQFRPHIGVSVTVTTDRAVFDSWPTDERWRVVTTNGGEFIDGAVLCRKHTEPGTQVTFAVTQRAEKTIWVGPCVAQPEHRLFTLAHEIGHMIGAEHCGEGLMRANDPDTLELSPFTQHELHELYDN